MSNEIKPTVENVQSCRCCEVGTVDRYGDCFLQCRNCGAIGDASTGLMDLIPEMIICPKCKK